MEQTFEATIEKRDKWYIGWVDAVPGAFSQGRTIKEGQGNLEEAVQLILEGHMATVPRHREIENFLAKKICRQLDINSPKTR